MAKAHIEHAFLTLTDIDVFVNFIRYLDQNDLLDEAAQHLKKEGKTEMFVDGDAMLLLGGLLKEHPNWDKSHTHAKPFCEHLRRLREKLTGS